MPTIISHKHKFIFCHIPRTGGTSFTEAVKPFLGPDDELDSWPKHTPLSAMMNPNDRTGKVFHQYKKIAIYRNDEERLESIRRINPKAPEDADVFWPNEKWICDRNGFGRNLADFLIRFEILEKVTKIAMSHQFGIDIKEFPHLNKRL